MKKLSLLTVKVGGNKENNVMTHEDFAKSLQICTIQAKIFRGKMQKIAALALQVKLLLYNSFIS